MAERKTELTKQLAYYTKRLHNFNITINKKILKQSRKMEEAKLIEAGQGFQIPG